MTLDLRIQKADRRMVQAKCEKWACLWCAMFYRLVDRRNAMAMVNSVRMKKPALGTGSGLSAARGPQGVAGLERQSTTSVCGSANGRN
jgi:hypothetical protein